MMKRMSKKLLAAALGLMLPLTAAAQETKTVAPGTPVTITVAPQADSAPRVTLKLLDRTGKVTPCSKGCVHTGGGNIEVSQPSDDTIVVIMSGVAVAYGTPLGESTAYMSFDLEQCFEVVFGDEKVKNAKLIVEGQVVGLLRSHAKNGGRAEDAGNAVITSAGTAILTVGMPSHQVCDGLNLSVNDMSGPHTVPVLAGKYSLHQTFHVAAAMPRAIIPAKAPSAEFAPDPALDPLWISHKEPFHGAKKGELGFKITIKVEAAE